MKFAFPILAIFVCLFAAYFSLTESAKFEKVQEARIAAINTNKIVTANADVADEKIKVEEELFKSAKDNLEFITQSVLNLQSTGNALKNEAGQLDAQLADQSEKFVQLDETLKQVQATLEGLGEDVDMDNLGEKITQIEESLAAKKIRAEEIGTLVTSAKTSLASKEEEVQRLISKKDARNRRISRNAMEARVTAVDQEWGFLIIGAGSNSGFTPQTSLLVQRDGRLIGRVKPSAVEPTQTVAEIDFETLLPGVRIQPGDRVILAKPSAN